MWNGKRKQVMMMSKSHPGKYQYYRGKNFQAVSLPYGTIGNRSRLSMKIFLPDKNSSLKKFCRQLNAVNWQQWLADFELIDGSIMLPRFKLEYEAPLKEPLEALGMGIAFDHRQANFTGLSSTQPGVYIEDARQKTFLEVNEKGTEAAAANILMLPMSAPLKTFKMVVDRPFFVAIDDNETGALLFMGAIVDPIQ